jgi:hypothetical protein
MKLSKNFSLSEFTESNTAERLGIDNNPNDEQLENMTLLCERILQPLRDEIGVGISVSSGLRNEALNQAIGGSSRSDHCKGLAGDIKCITGNHKLLFDTIVKMELPYKQLIWEFGDDEQPRWVHVALDLSDEPRRQKLKAVKIDGKTKYLSI